ncbi:MAG: hypothetical protein RJQ14_24550 [Marinoscillum sp.]
MMCLTSCLEDNLDFPEPDNTKTTASTALISYLHSLSKSNDTRCFDFVYPIKLRLSNDILLEVDSKSALIEISQDQNSGVYVKELSFPLLIIANTQINSIDSEQEFFELLQSCELPTLRSVLERTHKQCFDFGYPVTMRTMDSTSITIESLDRYIQFYYSDQPDNYQPNFIYPLDVNLFGQDTKKTIENTFEFYEVFNACGGCPELFVEYTKKDFKHYEFVASVTGAESFDWYVDDVFIQTGTPTNNVLTKALEPGFHELCIKAASDDCVLGEVFCLELTVEDPCPALFFESEQRGYGHYFFEANFERMQEVEFYKWYINGTFKEEERGNERDHVFEYFFGPGSYEVCIKTFSNDCPEGAQYCKQINVECVDDLSYAWDLETFGYTFTADFELRDQVTYVWEAYVDDRLVLSEKREARSGDDHDFIVQMETGTEYFICLSQEGCDDEKVCEEFAF